MKYRDLKLAGALAVALASCRTAVVGPVETTALPEIRYYVIADT